jgi:hypothetical protein
LVLTSHVPGLNPHRVVQTVRLGFQLSSQFVLGLLVLLLERIS